MQIYKFITSSCTSAVFAFRPAFIFILRLNNRVSISLGGTTLFLSSFKASDISETYYEMLSLEKFPCNVCII